MKEIGHVNDFVFPMPMQGAPGLTKREYFSAMALQGLLALEDVSVSSVVPNAVKLADQLIEELNK